MWEMTVPAGWSTDQPAVAGKPPPQQPEHIPPPNVRIDALRIVKDCLTGEMSLTVGVINAKGKLIESVYGVKRYSGTVQLTKEDGEIITVLPSGSCNCKDALYRHRATGCKHYAACLKAGLIQSEP